MRRGPVSGSRARSRSSVSWSRLPGPWPPGTTRTRRCQLSIRSAAGPLRARSIDGTGRRGCSGATGIAAAGRSGVLAGGMSRVLGAGALAPAGARLGCWARGLPRRRPGARLGCWPRAHPRCWAPGRPGTRPGCQLGARPAYWAPGRPGWQARARPQPARPRQLRARPRRAQDRRARRRRARGRRAQDRPRRARGRRGRGRYVGGSGRAGLLPGRSARAGRRQGVRRLAAGPGAVGGGARAATPGRGPAPERNGRGTLRPLRLVRHLDGGRRYRQRAARRGSGLGWIAQHPARNRRAPGRGKATRFGR